MIIMAIVGIIVLFIPGTLLTMLIGSKFTGLEKVCMSFGLSILVIVFLGFLLTTVGRIFYIKAITVQSVYASLIILSLILAAIYKLKF